MRILKITDEMSKRYLLARDSYNAAMKALTITLPDVPDDQRHSFYVNAFRDLCDKSIKLSDAETDIFETLHISGFEKIELNNVYTLEEEHDN